MSDGLKLTHDALSGYIESGSQQIGRGTQVWRDDDRVVVCLYGTEIARIGRNFIDFPEQGDAIVRRHFRSGTLLARVVRDNQLGTSAGLDGDRWMVNLGGGELAPLGGYTFAVGVRAAGERTPEPVGGQS